MIQRNHALKTLFAAFEDETDIHSVGVANRDTCLQIFKEDMPRAAKGVGTELEIAEIFHEH
jgi:hypothetical protein